MGRIIDENGRVFGFVNVIDLLVVLVVIAAVGAGTALVLGSSEETSSVDTENVTITVLSERVQPYVATAISSRNPVNSGNVSELENVSISPAEVVVEDSDGQLHVRDHPRLKRVEMQLRIEATKQQDTLRWRGHRIRIGNSVGLDFGDVTLSGEITTIQRDENK